MKVEFYPSMSHICTKIGQSIRFEVLSKTWKCPAFVNHPKPFGNNLEIYNSR